MARRARIEEELGWLKVIVVLVATATASVVSWLVNSDVALRTPRALIAFVWIGAIATGGITLGLVRHVYRLLSELEREG